MSDFSAELRASDLRRLRRKLGDVKAQKWIEKGLLASGKTIESKTGKYPPETSANEPGTYPSWYERGWGTRYPGGGGRKTSENLGKKWYTKSRAFNAVEVGNKASYAEYVHGDDQAAWLEIYGWKQLKEVAKEELPNIIKALKAQLNQILRS